MLLRDTMPWSTVPLPLEDPRHTPGSAPWNRFALRLRLCSWCRAAHSGGRLPVSVLFATLTVVRFAQVAHDAGAVPVQAHAYSLETTAVKAIDIVSP